MTDWGENLQTVLSYERPGVGSEEISGDKVGCESATLSPCHLVSGGVGRIRREPCPAPVRRDLPALSHVR